MRMGLYCIHWFLLHCWCRSNLLNFISLLLRPALSVLLKNIIPLAKRQLIHKCSSWKLAYRFILRSFSLFFMSCKRLPQRDGDLSRIRFYVYRLVKRRSFVDRGFHSYVKTSRSKILVPAGNCAYEPNMMFISNIIVAGVNIFCKTEGIYLLPHHHWLNIVLIAMKEAR